MRHFIGKNSNFSRISCTVPSKEQKTKENRLNEELQHKQSKHQHAQPCVNHVYPSKLCYVEIYTCTFSSEMISTEQWLRATRSTFTPYAPPHLVSPVTQPSPMQSLQLSQINYCCRNCRCSRQHEHTKISRKHTSFETILMSLAF